MQHRPENKGLTSPQALDCLVAGARNLDEIRLRYPVGARLAGLQRAFETGKGGYWIEAFSIA